MWSYRTCMLGGRTNRVGQFEGGVNREFLSFMFFLVGFTRIHLDFRFGFLLFWVLPFSIIYPPSSVFFALRLWTLDFASYARHVGWPSANRKSQIGNRKWINWLVFQSSCCEAGNCERFFVIFPKGDFEKRSQFIHLRFAIADLRLRRAAAAIFFAPGPRRIRSKNLKQKSD